MKNSSLYILILFTFTIIQVSYPGSVHCEETTSKIKLGITLPLTGTSAIWGKNAQNGINLALDELKQKKSPVEFEPIYEDIGDMNLTKAAAAAQKFINIDKVNLLCPIFSEDTEVVWPIATKRNVPVVSIRSAADKLTAQSPLLFSLGASDRTLVDAAIKLARKRAYKKAAVIAAQSAYFTSAVNIFKELWPKESLVLLEYPYGSNPDFRGMLSKAKEADVIFLFNDAQGLIMKQAQELAVKTPVFGFYLEVDPSMVTAPKSTDFEVVYSKYSPSTKSFANSYKKQFGENPGEPADYGYDLIRVLNEAVMDSGTSSEEIISGLNRIKDFPGASGSISFDEFGRRRAKTVEYWTYSSGTFKKMDK